MEREFELPGYRIIKLLGKGRHGGVYSAVKQENGQTVAIKKLNGTHNIKKKFREIDILKTCNHPNVVRMIEHLEIDDSLYIVMERLDSTLHHFLKIEFYLDHTQIKYIMYQLVCGLIYVHFNEIMHRDLKPDNVLMKIIDPQLPLQIKLADFSLSRYSYTHQIFIPADYYPTKYTKFNNLRYWSAPELILKEDHYDNSVDVWSLGCIYAELLNTMQSNVRIYLNRAPIFKRNETTQDYLPRELEGYVDLDEFIILDMMCQFLGTPNKQSLIFLEKEKAIELMSYLPNYQGVDIQQEFPGCNLEEIEILSKLLKFNSKERISLEELINMPYFDPFLHLGYHEIHNSQ